MAPFPSATKEWHQNTYAAISPTRPELSAAGKTILITGGGTGIGAETARAFAAAGAARIAIVGRRLQPLLDTKASIEAQSGSHVEIFTSSVDVTKQASVDAAFAQFVGDGKLDIVISNAAVAGPVESVAAVDTDAFLSAVTQNITGSLYVAQAFLRHASPQAVAIEISSAAAHINMGGAFAAYGVSKMANFKLWEALAFANPELSVYHVQPGVVATEMNAQAGGPKAAGTEDHVSLPASFCVWLASPESRFLKNKFVWANWDVEELKARAKEIEGSELFSINLVGWPFNQESYQFNAPKKE